MREISLHILDIAENSIAAAASVIEIQVCENIHQDLLEARVRDNGRGMDAETVARVVDPFYTTRTTRKVGLGIPLLKAAAEACNGGLTVDSEPGKGTLISVRFQHNHIDRMPLGDLPGTFLVLLVAYPAIHWKLTYQVVPSGQELAEEFFFDSNSMGEYLGDLPISEPSVLNFMRNYLTENIHIIQNFAAAEGSPLPAAGQ
jgi:hypothetical protein